MTGLAAVKRQVPTRDPSLAGKDTTAPEYRRRPPRSYLIRAEHGNPGRVWAVWERLGRSTVRDTEFFCREQDVHKANAGRVEDDTIDVGRKQGVDGRKSTGNQGQPGRHLHAVVPG
jgi:hypothetical protein